MTRQNNTSFNRCIKCSSYLALDNTFHSKSGRGLMCFDCYDSENKNELAAEISKRLGIKLNCLPVKVKL